MAIHSTAIIESTLPSDIQVGAFCHIEAGVVVGSNVRLDDHVILKRGTQLGDNVHVHSFVCLGDDPQIKSLDTNYLSGVVVGDRCEIREGVTIHRASKPEQFTKIGHDCLLMAYSHIGHDSQIGNHCILANNALVAGEVTIEDYVFLSGAAAVHQFVCIGESAFISGHAAITAHVAPFVTVTDRNQVHNLNVIGLQRRQFTSAEVNDVKNCYRYVFQQDILSFKKLAQEALTKHVATTHEGEKFLKFFLEEKTPRGFAYPVR